MLAWTGIYDASDHKVRVIVLFGVGFQHYAKFIENIS